MCSVVNSGGCPRGMRATDPGSVGADQAEHVSVEASAKPWKYKMCLLVLGPSSSHRFDEVQRRL